MSIAGMPPGSTEPSHGEPVSWIEAALQAALGHQGPTRPDLARESLRKAQPPSSEALLEVWLDAVMRELQSNASALVPEEMVEIIAARIMANRQESLGAHARVEPSAIKNLFPQP